MADALLEIGELEGWLEHLSHCKPLGEEQVRRLCEKVTISILSADLSSIVVGAGTFYTRKQCTASKLPSDCLW